MKNNNRLREIRKAHGLSLEAVAVEIGVSYSTLINWEAGKVDPPVSKVIKLSKFYGVSIYDLFPDEEKEAGQ